MTLLDAAKSLDRLERTHLAAIAIEPSDGGYRAIFQISLMIPAGVPQDLPTGVSASGVERYPDIIRTIDWRIPIWQQIRSLLDDAELLSPQNLGTMGAVEKSSDEASKSWVVVTHGPPRSAERREWIMRTKEDGATF